MPQMPGMIMQPTNLIQAQLNHLTSGTSSEPASTPMYMIMGMHGSWMWMLHGEAFITDIQQKAASTPQGERGGDRLFSTNWIMPMAMRRVQGRNLATRDSDTLPDPATAGDAGSGRPARLDPDLRERILECYDDQQVLFRTESRTIARLEVETGDRPVLVPEMDQDVHDLRGLRQVAEALAPAPPASATKRRASS